MSCSARSTCALAEPTQLLLPAERMIPMKCLYRLRLLLLVALLLGTGSSARAELLFNTNATWRFLKGLAEASTPDVTAWRRLDFVDSAFVTAPAPFWYGDVFPGGTQLADMLNNYSCIFLRRTFVTTNLSNVSGLRLGYHCDDGFVIWVNGVEIFRYNMPAGPDTPVAFNGLAGPAVTEPVQFVVIDLPGASMLTLGTNIVALQAFNTALSSSDLGINVSLATIAPDPTPPVVATVSPAPGASLSALTQVTVTFSEPVAGVNPSDLVVNGVPASSMTGGNDTYTFNFAQPAYGSLQLGWAAGHGITDLGIPPNPFNATGPGATWQYSLVDTVPPTLGFQLPFAGASVRSLLQIEVDFSEAVTGVDAADLVINGQPATNAVALASNVYVFKFPPPAPGPVQVSFAAGHGIRDLASVPNPFAGASWSYVLDPNAPVTSVRLNEIVAVNINGLRDEDNQAQDWVELYNTSTSTISLAGWTLSDDEGNPEKWVFPPVNILAKGYLLVFCSAKDRRPTTPGGKLHTNFKLSPDGEFLGLYNAEAPRQLVSSFNPYPNQRRDYSYGFDPLDQPRYFAAPTPGTSNTFSAVVGVVGDTHFSRDRGMYTNAFSLSITCATPGVTIRYTLNGTAPTTNVGLTYTSPLVITNTTVVRAFAYKANLLPSDTDAQTYLFLDDVIRQAPTGAAPAGWPATWGGNSVDYGMDPDIVNTAPWRDTIKDDLKAIPTLSIVMNLDDLFNASTGIYANPGGDTIAWERGGSLELIYPDDTQGFQINCGVRIRGGFSRSTSNPKHAFRVFFRQEYGASKLNFPMFGPTGAQSFDKFDIRTMQNYSWAFQGDGSMMCLRDVSSRDAQLKMNGFGTRGNFYHLYINGMYWGLYNTEERAEAAFGESYLGGRAEDYDTIKVAPDDGYIIYATDGTMAAWTRLWQAAANGFANDADYFRVQGLNVDGTPNPAYENLVDVPNLIDYMLVILYGGNLDAPISNFLGNSAPNNWFGLRDRTGAHGGFRFLAHDSEHTLLDANSNRIGPFAAGDPVQQGAGTALTKSNPQYVWWRMWSNPEFKMLMADRVQLHCFNGGPLSTEGMRASLLTRSNEIQRAIVAESARWGDAKVTTPYTRNSWLSAFNSVFNNFAGPRTANLIAQLRAAGLFPALNAPTFSSNGGAVSNGFSLFLNNNNGAGTIYYTLNGSDPRQRGGAISASALAYASGTPIVISFPTTVRARIRNGTVWSAITEATFYPVQDFSGLLLTEIMYNPLGAGVVSGDEYEFLEFKNAGSRPLDLTGVRLEGVGFSFTNGTRLAPGQFFVLGRNTTTLTARYPGLVVNGLYAGRLNNGGETLTLRFALGSVLLSVSYQDSGKWPLAADGFGYSLVPRGLVTNQNSSGASGWRASTNPGGSPGADDPAPTLPAIVINEVLTHTDLPAVDYIELFNPTLAEVNVGGWYLTDDRAVPLKYRIPDGRSIAAGGYLLFTEADFNATPGTNNSFSLSSLGEEVYLISAGPAANLTGYTHGFSFGAAEKGVSFGRLVTSAGEEKFVAQVTQTPNALNSGPRIGPVVFRQIMYHPPDVGGLDDSTNEFLELRNRSGAAVALYDPAFPTNVWRLRGVADFELPSGVSLGAGASLLLVNFDPADATARGAFLSKYRLLAGVPLYGPYRGKLDNSTGPVVLQRPSAPDTNGVAYFVVEEVDYKDAAPWPVEPDGGGAALQRLDLAAFGDDPANWIGSAPLTIASLVPASFAGRPGTNATFTVTAYGTGRLQYQWFHNGITLPGATSSTLTLSNVQTEDDGPYTVRVTDATGSALSPAALLQVLVPITIVQAPVGQTVAVGGAVSLSAIIAGSPPPFTYEWRRVTFPPITNTVLSSDHTSFLRFTGSSVASTTVWRLVAKNLASTSGVAPPTVLVITQADADGDGIPDEWETANGLNPNSPADGVLDSDGDGMSNQAEFIAGTDPRDPASNLRVRQATPGSPAEVSFPAVSNRTYSVHYCDDLNAGLWLKLSDIVGRTTNRVETVLDSHAGTNRFYRISTPQLP